MTSNTLLKSKVQPNTISWISQYDSLVVFGGFSIAIIGTIIFTGLFHAGDSVRSNLLFNSICGLGMALLFIWLIFKFMGSQIVVFGKKIDVGMIIYVFIVLFVVFIFGN